MTDALRVSADLLSRLASAAVITVCIETLFFIFAGRRGKYFLAVVVLANLLTNICLNICVFFIWLTPVSDFLKFFIYPLEIAVVLVEYLIYRVVEQPSKKLFLLTALANMLSYGMGLVIFGHI